MALPQTKKKDKQLNKVNFVHASYFPSCKDISHAMITPTERVHGFHKLPSPCRIIMTKFDINI